MKDCSNNQNKEPHSQIESLKAAINGAETIIIGAGAGLSSSAGYEYSNDRFKKYFYDFYEKYGFTDMYSGGFYPYKTLEEYWAYWSRYIYINRYMLPPVFSVYKNLFELVKEKDYFVLTTNVDHCFQRAGFAKDRLFYTQGDFGLFQCSVPCHQNTYDNFSTVEKMVKAQGFSIFEDGTLSIDGNLQNGVKDSSAIKMHIPSDLLPVCPVCKEPMSMNLRSDCTFVEDYGWHKACKSYRDFLASHVERVYDIFQNSLVNSPLFAGKIKDGSVLFLELGVGMNTPGIIKYPFWIMTGNNKSAKYVCINAENSAVPQDIKDSSICITGDIGKILSELM